MLRGGLAFVIILAVAAGISGCGRRSSPGVLQGGQHVPLPPSEQHLLWPQSSSGTPSLSAQHAPGK